MGVEVLYTNTDSIRAVLGLSAQDLSDASIVAANLNLQIEDVLERWLPDHATVKTSGEAAGATTEEKRAWRRLRLYTQYLGAYLLCDALQLGAVQQVGDGTAQMRRFSSDIENIKGKMEIRAQEFQTLLAEDKGITLDSGAFSFIGLSLPGADPVTGS